MSKRLNVYKDQKPIYDIVMEPSFEKLTEEVNKFHLSERKICIVTDTNVAPLYLEEVKERLSKCCKKISYFVIPAGEENKNLDTVKKIYEHLILEHFDRKDMLAALGGGVIGDMCGFTAATYLRGIDFIQIPTTLLAQVDSSVGGKVGVDYGSYKNVVGAFYQPKFVYINTSTIDTLPYREFAAGMAEVIKYGIIQSEDFYDFIRENKDIIKSLDKEALKTIICACCKMKADVVAEDEHDTGLREILNYGHTIGHAVEGLKEFELIHGECVSIGMSAVMDISEKRGCINSDKVDEIRELLKYFKLPVSVKGLEKNKVYEQLFHDKKVSGGKLKFVLAEQIGKAVRTSDVSKEEVMSAIEAVLED